MKQNGFILTFSPSLIVADDVIDLALKEPSID